MHEFEVHGGCLGMERAHGGAFQLFWSALLSHSAYVVVVVVV